jgi:hypothetical protein
MYTCPLVTYMRRMKQQSLRPWNLLERLTQKAFRDGTRCDRNHLRGERRFPLVTGSNNRFIPSSWDDPAQSYTDRLNWQTLYFSKPLAFLVLWPLWRCSNRHFHNLNWLKFLHCLSCLDWNPDGFSLTESESCASGAWCWGKIHFSSFFYHSCQFYVKEKLKELHNAWIYKSWRWSLGDSCNRFVGRCLAVFYENAKIGRG